jgi:hypothetical protein
VPRRESRACQLFTIFLHAEHNFLAHLAHFQINVGSILGADLMLGAGHYVLPP